MNYEEMSDTELCEQLSEFVANLIRYGWTISEVSVDKAAHGTLSCTEWKEQAALINAVLRGRR